MTSLTLCHTEPTWLYLSGLLASNLPINVKIIQRRSWINIPLPGEVIGLINRESLSCDVSIKVGNNVIDEDINCVDESNQLRVEAMLEQAVKNTIENPVKTPLVIAKSKPNLSSIHENDDQFIVDMNDKNNTNDTY